MFDALLIYTGGQVEVALNILPKATNGLDSAARSTSTSPIGADALFAVASIRPKSRPKPTMG